jgi:RND family efflux transporter MFP subunit
MSPDSVNRPISSRALRIAAIAALTLGASIVSAGIATRAANGRHVRDLTSEQALPVVSIADPQRGDRNSVLELPGRLQAYSTAPIYARVSGYLKAWKVDIGTPVRAGQLLAEIEAPDIDQQLAQAQADLMTARANARLATTTAARWAVLLKTHSVSQQDADTKNGDLEAKAAILKATQANVDRLQVMEGFKRIVAPFDGVVTARDTDVGALINAGSAQGPQLFVISDTHKLRLYVNVPQSEVGRVTSGTHAQITVPERPDRTFSAVVESSAHSVDPASGSTLVQLAVNNDAGELSPGAYANVRFDLPLSSTNLSVPASSVIFDHDGVRVAIVGSDNRVSLKPVTIARDLGDAVEISSGLSASDHVIDGPPDGIGNGDQVRIAPGSSGGKMLATAAAPKAPSTPRSATNELNSAPAQISAVTGAAAPAMVGQ